MKAESRMRQRVRLALRGLDPISIENPVHPGTPDLNYVEGFVELKIVEKWPERATTILRLPHFTPQQRVWLTRRVRAGGRAFLLLRVGSEWLLFRGDRAAEIVGRGTRVELEAAAIGRWETSLDDEQLRALLTADLRDGAVI
jgi:hypothetical protein